MQGFLDILYYSSVALFGSIWLVGMLVFAVGYAVTILFAIFELCWAPLRKRGVVPLLFIAAASAVVGFLWTQTELAAAALYYVFFAVPPARLMISFITKNPRDFAKLHSAYRISLFACSGPAILWTLDHCAALIWG